MQVMTEQNENKGLSGLIEVDHANPGGLKSGGKRGRGSENKQAFVAAVKITEENHPIDVELAPVKVFTKKKSPNGPQRFQRKCRSRRAFARSRFQAENPIR